LAVREAIAEIEFKIRQIKTPWTDCYELAAQRWFVESFIDCGFHIRRHEAADAVIQVFGLDHSRSRQLFDLTMVSLRRELVDSRRLVPVPPASLLGTKGHALFKFARYLSPEEFTRLAVLMRDIAPDLVFRCNRKNLARMRRGDVQAIRANLDLILWGLPIDRPLFTQPVPAIDAA